MADGEERITETRERAAKVGTRVVDVYETEGKGGTVRRGGRRIVSPLDDLRYRERITEQQHLAGTMYYRDWSVVTQGGSPKSAMASVQGGGVTGGGVMSETRLDAAEHMAHCSRRLDDANRWLGSYMGSIARMLLVEEMTAMDIGEAVFGHRHNNSKAAAGIALITATLDRLAQIYRLT